MYGKTELLHIVRALRSGRSFANLLHGREKETDEDSDD
jgi:hypothetical protein